MIRVRGLTPITPKLNNNKTNNPVKKWSKNLNRHFSKKKKKKITVMANKHRKRCTMSGHCGSANQKHCEVHFIHSILVILRKKKISVGKDVENLVISFIAGGNIHGPAAMESTWQLSNKLKIELSYELTSSFPRYITKRVENRCSNKNLSTICIELLFE